jgi:hypothetical protein
MIDEKSVRYYLYYRLQIIPISSLIERKNGYAVAADFAVNDLFATCKGLDKIRCKL